MTEFKDPIMLILNDAFLTAGDKQLKIAFNPQVSSYKINVSESRTDTIGSKYPFITRNGDVYYASFPIGGLISSEMDEAGTFETRKTIYEDNESYYSDYNDNNDIPNNQDMVYEKFFRDKVMDFLCGDEAMLYRSPTEGNKLVRLMDVNYSPNQTLGRRLWSFTATAYEIDDCTLENYNLYDIYTNTGSEGVVATTSKGNSLMPIRRIIFVNNKNEFPTEGREQVIYVYDNQIYIWNSEDNKYQMVSVPE